MNAQAQIRVLIVEDDPDQARLLLYGLTKEGFLAAVVESATSALLRLKQEIFDVVLSDLNMPGIRGDEFLRRLRNDHPSVAFAMYTGETQDVSAAVNAFRNGIDDYLTKPMSTKELAKALVGAVHNRQRELFMERQLRMARHGQFEAVYRTQRALVRAMETKDMYTRHHSVKVAYCTVLMAREMGLDRPRMRTFKVAALLHDIGKIGVPLTVLHKEGALDDKEWEIIKKHTTDGAHIVEPLKKYLPEVVSIVRHEHERWDGTGYPDGIGKLDIPLASRLIMIADTYDAICSDRAYRKAQSPEVAAEVIRAGAGTQFDPDLVPIFERSYHQFPKPELGAEAVLEREREAGG
ncbi:MAG: response regulator [Planctomycetota bacterium]|nr:response regulator [Planctomycetota bacterium]